MPNSSRATDTSRAQRRSRMARQRHRRLVLDGREHGGTLISAGVKVLSEADASCLWSGWVPHRARRRALLAVSRLTEVTCTTVPAGTQSRPVCADRKGGFRPSTGQENL